jgi:hypothetical protein
MKYSLLLHSLEPKPTRQELEEISADVPSIARVDSGGILKDWYGIVISGLPLPEAYAFQASLKVRGIETDVVDDLDVPALYHGYRCQGIVIDSDGIALTDAMGSCQVRAISDLVFVSAALLKRDKTTRKQEQRILTTRTYRPLGGIYSTEHMAWMENTSKVEDALCFRADLFFTTAPNRISFEIHQNNVMIYNGLRVRLQETAGITEVMSGLKSLLPPERTNEALRKMPLHMLYPSMHAYEEEIRWMFYRLGAKG